MRATVKFSLEVRIIGDTWQIITDERLSYREAQENLRWLSKGDEPPPSPRNYIR